MNESFTLTTFLEPKDEVDKNTMAKTITMAIGLQLDNLLLSDKLLFESYLGHIMDLTEKLLKVNHHRRKYIIQKERVISFLKQNSNSDENNTNSAYHSVELDAEIDGFLTQIKAALDSLVKTFEPLFGIKLLTWGKIGKESGRRVLVALQNNLSNTFKTKSQRLLDIIEDNIEWISYIVSLRDNANHHGGLKNLSNITFNRQIGDVVPQYISHTNGRTEEVSIFLERTVYEIVEFVHSVLILSLLTKSSDQLVIVRNEEEEFPPFRWGITGVKK